MRIVDVSVGALIGLSSMALLAAWNPYPLANQAHFYVAQASLRDYLTQIVSTQGVAWFQRASPDAVCEALSSYSNSSVRVSAAGKDFLCFTGPPQGIPAATLTLELPTGTLTLEAWQLAER